MPQQFISDMENAYRVCCCWGNGWGGRDDGSIRVVLSCLHDERRLDLIEHEIATLVGQRVFGIALGYEDLNDHDDLRHDPIMAVLAAKLEARREACAPVAGISTLNRLESPRSRKKFQLSARLSTPPDKRVGRKPDARLRKAFDRAKVV
jgi:hypothetical protein